MIEGASPELGPRVIAVVNSMSEWHAAIRARADEVGLSRQTLDQANGMPDGYCGKLFCNPPMRIAGPASFFPVTASLGLAVQLVEDPALMLRVQNHPRRCAKSVRVGKNHWRHAKRLGTITEAARRNGAKGGRTTFANMDATRLREHQSRAAKARWRKWR